jgi:hypothetical protein
MIKIKMFSLIALLVLAGSLSCEWEKMSPALDCASSPIIIDLIESNGAECGAANGSFVVNATGGEAPFTFTLEEISTIDGVFENISAGSYNVRATDAKGCSETLTVTIQNLDGVNLTDAVTSDSGCNSASGTIQLSASGGQEPYIYSINGGTEQSSNMFGGLPNGTYAVSVKDQLGCEIIQNVQVFTGISFENSIQAIITNNCATSGCHNGSIFPDLRSFSNIQARASSIKARTANKSMPRGSTLSQEQIDIIACWVDDGALQN